MGTAKNSLGNQLGELEGRLADAENAAMKGGKAAMAKMEGKIRELEAELASTQSRTGKQPRLSRGLSARAKSSPLPKEKIGRTRTACLNLLQSSKGRSKPTNSR